MHFRFYELVSADCGSKNFQYTNCRIGVVLSERTAKQYNFANTFGLAFRPFCLICTARAAFFGFRRHCLKFTPFRFYAGNMSLNNNSIARDDAEIQFIVEYMSQMGEDVYYTESFMTNETMGEVYLAFANKPTAAGKFLYTYDLLEKHNKLPSKLPVNVLLREPKSNKKACSYRSMANVRFLNKDYVSALREYNMSIMSAEPNSEDYAFALANRSAALYHLEEYNDSIRDIHRALANNYPNTKSYKLYEREIKCLKNIGKISEAKSKFEEFSSYLALALLPKKKMQDIKFQLNKFLSECNSVSNEDEKIEIKLLGGPNNNIPALSKHIQLKYSESMGRCLVASSDFRPGDVLAIEKPFAGVLRKESFGHNCHYCFKRCLSGIPCINCNLVIYCDEICHSKSFVSSHEYECRMLTAFNRWPSMEYMEHLSLIIFLTSVTKLGLDQYVADVRALSADSTDPIMRGFNAHGKYLSNEFCSSYTLEGNEKIRKMVGLKIPDHHLGTVGESLVHIICVVASNAHGITQTHRRKTWKIANQHEFMPVASFLMPVLSLLNHHCDPNVVRHNYNGTIVLRAIQPISKNSQLFDNYGKLYATHELESRQKVLMNQFHFHCECKPCEENWPVYDVLKNQLDSERIMLYTDTNQDLLKENEYKLRKIILAIRAKNTDGLEHIQFLYNYLDVLHSSMKKPFREYCDCQETIKQILYSTPDKFIIEKY